jgi:tetratricopeptide (TPR) repeat protein
MAGNDRRGGSRPAGRSQGPKGRGQPKQPWGKGRGGPPRKGKRPPSRQTPEERREERSRGPKQWGGVARRGAGKIGEAPFPDSAAAEWRRAVARAGDGAVAPQAEWIEDDDDPAGDEWDGEAWDGEAPTIGVREEVGLSDQERRTLNRASGKRAKDHEQRLNEAARAFRAGRFEDARRILADLVEWAPSVPAIRELYGLTLYRLRRWKLAVAQLEAFRTLTGSTEQHPVLADCYRALHRPAKVAELWDELREASPSAELVTEGRIVAAGALADRGDVADAIDLLAQKGWRMPRNPQEHHLRRAYALADLWERAGEVARARDLFERIQRADGRFGDVGKRVKQLH